MKKVCLVKGGNFFLGIEARYILSRQKGTLPQETVSKERVILHLGSLLSQKHCERPEPGSTFLHLHKGKNSFFLLVDQVIDEIELSEQTTRLPPSSPKLTDQLCPQVAVWMNRVVLLLDPAQVIPVAQKLGQGIGIVAPEHCVHIRKPVVDEKTDVVEDTDQQAEKKSHKYSKTASKAVKDGGAVLSSQIRKNKKRPKSVDEETFKRVMAWTITQFKQGKVSREHLKADQLPPGLVQQEGLSDTVIQYLIDQISLRCQESITPTQPGEHHGG
ncbi:MAG: hypothetical protein D3910_06245 [Candidatus Electrothrix sp. ATG2]|nr:hypothetical protein [Candidatus Electrothrix sp. ATG2]